MPGFSNFLFLLLLGLFFNWHVIRKAVKHITFVLARRSKRFDIRFNRWFSKLRVIVGHVDVGLYNRHKRGFILLVKCRFPAYSCEPLMLFHLVDILNDIATVHWNPVLCWDLFWTVPREANGRHPILRLYFEWFKFDVLEHLSLVLAAERRHICEHLMD
jgi:hypothetical protein